LARQPHLFEAVDVTVSMALNLDRFKNDLDRLNKQAVLLEFAMDREISGDEAFKKRYKDALDAKQLNELLKKLPDFKVEYEAWYSECLVLLRQVLPDRVDNFISLYEKPKSRKAIEYGNYVIQDYMQGLHVKNWDDSIKVDRSAALPQFRQQCAILNAAKVRFESSIFEIRQLVQADLFDSEIEAARELHKNKFSRAAGAVAGVVLEKHLRQVCDDHGIKLTKKHPGISDLNEALKANSVVDIPQWRHISMLGDIRNLCDHSKEKEPTSSQILDLINGADKVLKTIS
jgi:hypothetical protein